MWFCGFLCDVILLFFGFSVLPAWRLEAVQRSESTHLLHRCADRYRFRPTLLLLPHFLRGRGQPAGTPQSLPLTKMWTTWTYLQSHFSLESFSFIPCSVWTHHRLQVHTNMSCVKWSGQEPVGDSIQFLLELQQKPSNKHYVPLSKREKS